MSVSIFGLCVISDDYFVDYPSISHMSNKHENRPYYLAVKQDNGIIWVVPLSSQVEKYEAKIKADEEKHGTCIYYYVTRLKGKKSAFLIGNVIPVTDHYIKKPFTVNNVPFVIQDKNDIKLIKSKLSRYLTLVRQGKMKPSVDILGIEKSLLTGEKR